MGLLLNAPFTPTLLASFVFPQTAANLEEVRTVYVGSLGRKQSAAQLRRDLISELKRSNGPLWSYLATPHFASADIGKDPAGKLSSSWHKPQTAFQGNR